MYYRTRPLSIVPVQDVPVLSAPLVLVLAEVEPSEHSPVALEHAKHAVGKRLPESIVVYLREALVQSEEVRSVPHLSLNSVLCVGSVMCVWGVCDVCGECGRTEIIDLNTSLSSKAYNVIYVKSTIALNLTGPVRITRLI